MCGYSLRAKDDCCDYGDYACSERESGIPCLHCCPAWDLPHSSYSLGSKIPVLNCKCIRCPSYWNKCFACPWFASLVIFEQDEFEGTERAICFKPEQSLICAMFVVLAGVLVWRAADIVLSANSLIVRGLYSLRLATLLFHPIFWAASCLLAITGHSLYNYSIRRGVWADGWADKR